MKWTLPTTKYSFASFNFPRFVVTIPNGRPESRKGKPSMCGPYIADPGVQPSERFFFYLASDFDGCRHQWCDEVTRAIRHTGWYCDIFQHEKIRGIVVRLNHGRGYLAGWSIGEGMASELDRSTVYDNEEDAAFAADSMAESAAEREQQYKQEESERLEAEESDFETFNEAGEV